MSITRPTAVKPELGDAGGQKYHLMQQVEYVDLSTGKQNRRISQEVHAQHVRMNYRFVPVERDVPGRRLLSKCFS